LRDDSADGEVNPNYVQYMTGIPCNIVQITGGEIYRGKQIQAETTTVIEFRNLQGLSTEMVFENLVSNQQYLIRRILEHHGRDRVLIAEATEVVN
jgi:hypothetical protein